MSPPDAIRAALEALIVEWRDDAAGWWRTDFTAAAVANHCADQLDALLEGVKAPAVVQPTPIPAPCRHQDWYFDRCIDCFKTSNQIQEEKRLALRAGEPPAEREP